MNKYFIGAVVGVAAFSLAACGDSATPIEGTTEKSDLALEEVFNKAMERQESLHSVKANIIMEQGIVMTVDGEEVQMTSSTNIVMSATVKPMAFFVDGTMSMTMAGEEESFDMPLNMYLTEADGFYMNDTMSGGWIKLPDEMYDELLAQVGANADTKEQLQQLKPFLKDFKFEQKNEEYILTLYANGEKFNDMILKQVAGSMSQQLDGEALLNGMEVKDAKYVITIDKQTFDTRKMNMDFVMKFDVEGMSAEVNTLSTITYSNFNNVDTIIIPQDVLDTAIDSDF